MGVYTLTESEEKFANIIWNHEPLGSGELVKLCEKEMNVLYQNKCQLIGMC